MHRQNEEAWLNPETSQKKATVTRPTQREDRLPPIDTVSGFAPVQTSMYARGNVFPNQPTLHQLTELDKHKLCLKQQIEEKHLKEAEEREKLRLEEVKEERRLAEQRAQIKREFDEDQEIRRLKEMKVQREISPPIPTLQKRHRAPQSTPSPPSMDSKRSTTPLSKGSLSVLQSQTPSVPAVRKELGAAGNTS
ncbi:centrosome and spindle pole-associated protein 1-like [Osmerus eperlanus]|uniref:centrosome and spindle pole-associated protein 1-like n=1 Tax=Osmerus eperlanus TaxID=29151 RepID=UPI002E165D90